MTRLVARAAGLALAALVVAAPASAQIVSSFQVGAGGFFPRGYTARVDNDVLVRDLDGAPLAGTTDTDALAFRIGDFKSFHAFAEYNVGVGPHLEFGLGVGRYGRTVPTVYRDVTEQPSNREIEQELSMRVVPVTFIARFLPFGDPSGLQPYIGIGVASLNYRYTESGDFVDSDTLAIFRDTFRAKGTTMGGVLTGGLRVPINGDIYALTLDGRYIYGVGDTGGTSAGFLADRIDLSGGMFNVGFIVRF